MKIESYFDGIHVRWFLIPFDRFVVFFEGILLEKDK